MIEVGTVLWTMRGTEKNGVITWYASPVSVEKVDDTKVMFGVGGCSLNSIGKNYFMSRDECIDHFLKIHDSLKQEIVQGTCLPDNVHSLPRTDWDDQIIYKYNYGVNDCGVYLGGLSRLESVIDKLEWSSTKTSMIAQCGTIETVYEEEYLTLKQIYEQVSEFADHELITVIQNDPMKAHIYQCNNYEKGKWVKLGTCLGYS